MQQNLSAFVKEMRKNFNLTQTDLADKSGVGLRFVRELEQGKPTLRLDKINQVLALFGKKNRSSQCKRIAHIMKTGKVYMYNQLAGILTEDETGYTFTYDS